MAAQRSRAVIFVASRCADAVDGIGGELLRYLRARGAARQVVC